MGTSAAAQRRWSAFPGAELNRLVDALARRMTSFDRRAMAQQRIKALLEHGLQQDSDFPRSRPAVLDPLLGA